MKAVPINPKGISAAFEQEGDEASWCAHNEHEFVDLEHSDPDLEAAKKCSKCGYVELLHKQHNA